MIDPLNPEHRQRLSRSVDYSYRELRKFNGLRDTTVRAYLGVSRHTLDMHSSGLFDNLHSKSKHQRNLPKGNLLQSAGLGLQIALAYGEPQFVVKARTAEHVGTAEKLSAALNRMSTLLNLGETARSIAADSFFGYGIYKVGVGCLPASAQASTGLEYGPCVWRVSQNNFIYDLDAASWDDVSYVGDIYDMPLNEALNRYPQHADRIGAVVATERLDSKHVLPHRTDMYSAEERVFFVDIFFPKARVVATWPIKSQAFGELVEEPVATRPYKGHWSGIYQVLNHLYAPDELVPVAQAESVKSMHFLFNDLLHLTSEQALNAKVNPTYRHGNDKDMYRLWNAKDRMPVGLTQQSAQELGMFEIPGPSQSQTAYMSAMFNFFKEFVPTLDDPAKAPTAAQGSLERQTTNATVAEAKRKFNRALQLVGYKLGHLLMESDDLTLPSSRPLIPGSSISVDMTFLPSSMDPRGAQIDDFDIAIEPYSTQYRSPQERLQQLLGMNQQIVSMMQLAAQGAPINIKEVIDTISDYSGLPEIKSWYQEVDPMHQARVQESRAQAPRVGVGQYVRENVSRKTNEGALEQNLTQGMSEQGGSQPRLTDQN